jgi:hypothetical protein
MSSEIEDFELSLASNTAEGTTETADLLRSHVTCGGLRTQT